MSGTCPDASCTATTSTTTGSSNGNNSTTTTAPNVTDDSAGGVAALDVPLDATVPSTAAAGDSDNTTLSTTVSSEISKANSTTEGCDTVAADLEACVVLNCAFRNCNDNPPDGRYPLEFLHRTSPLKDVGPKEN